METIIEVGDTVRLKVGVALTRIQALRGEALELIECAWHDGAKPCCVRYPAAGLICVRYAVEAESELMCNGRLQVPTTNQ